MHTIEYLISHFLVIGLVSLLLLAILSGFIVKFVLPALRIRAGLSSAVNGLMEVKPHSERGAQDLSAISDRILVHEMFAHPWSQYRDTLHAQRISDASGREESRFRATTLAETFFSEQALVDTPLKTEFYKHVPGILTGLGIIGTFSGLITGLVRFEVSGDAERVRASLNGLIQSVGWSFVVSASAISLAMLFIWLEKSLTAACYREVEKLCRLIDSMFDAGAGEEYLARLVTAAEASALHASDMKQSLAIELKGVLSEMMRQQMKASALLQRQLSENMAQTFTETIREPMDRISHAVECVGTNQGEAVSALVTDVLANFADRMNDMLGENLNTISASMQQTAVTMQSAAIEINRLSDRLQTTDRGAAETMIDRLNSAMTSMEARQQAIDTHMVEFIGQVGSLAHSSQSQATRDLETFVGRLGERITDIVTRLEAQSGQAAKEFGTRQVQLTRYTNTAMGEISAQVQTLAQEMRQASEVMRASVAGLSQTTRDSMTLFNAGANTLNTALSGFAKAGQGVNNTMMVAAKATEKIGAASSNLVDAANGVHAVMDDYRDMSRVFAAMVAELRAIVENARKEASMTAQVVTRIQKAAEQLDIAGDRAGEYLHGVTEVLAQAHAEFAGNIELTLRKSNSRFHEELSRSVSLISGAIQDFGDVLDSVMEKGEMRCSA